jgi:hypothetical protein
MTTALHAPPASFEAFHTDDLPQLLDERVPLPAEYARTLRPLAIRIRETGETITYIGRERSIEATPGDARASTLVELGLESWGQLVQDVESAPGLIYGQRVVRVRGELMQLLQWEPALRWLYTGRPVYDPDTVDLRDAHGEPLDPERSFTLEDDRSELAHFLRTTGYLWLRGVLSDEEVQQLRAEAEQLRAAAREGDQESWWGRRADGTSVLCRVLRAGVQPKMRSLHGDPRLFGLAELCDVPLATKQGPEDKDGVTPCCGSSRASRKGSAISPGTATAAWAVTRACARLRC